MYATSLDPMQYISFSPSLSPLFCLSPLCSGAQNRACFSLPVTRILSQNMTQYRALLLFFIIYTMCPTQSHIIQLWKPWCNSIHIKAACLSAAPSPKNLHIYCPTSLSRSATSLPSATWRKKKKNQKHFCHATCRELTDLIHKFSLVFPFSLPADFLSLQHVCSSGQKHCSESI